MVMNDQCCHASKRKLSDKFIERGGHPPENSTTQVQRRCHDINLVPAATTPILTGGSGMESVIRPVQSWRETPLLLGVN
jgi:hypothetical protein